MKFSVFSMTIHNFSEFYNLLVKCNLSKISPFAEFVSIVDDYKAHCMCTNPSQKESKKSKCVITYRKIVNNNLANYMPSIKSILKCGPISFLCDGSILKNY